MTWKSDNRRRSEVVTGQIVKTVTRRQDYSFLAVIHPAISAPPPHQANKIPLQHHSTRYIIHCHPRQAEAPDLQRATQRRLLLEGQILALGRRDSRPGTASGRRNPQIRALVTSRHPIDCSHRRHGSAPKSPDSRGESMKTSQRCKVGAEVNTGQHRSALVCMLAPRYTRTWLYFRAAPPPADANGEASGRHRPQKRAPRHTVHEASWFH